MPRSTAVIATAHAARYLQQLCKHWSHRFAATFDPASGHIDFGGGEGLWLLADATALTLTAGVPDTGDLATLEQVVADHLQRFAFREALQIDWRPAA